MPVLRFFTKVQLITFYPYTWLWSKGCHWTRGSSFLCVLLMLSSSSQCTFCYQSDSQVRILLGWPVVSKAAQGWKMVFSSHCPVNVYICGSNPASSKAVSMTHGKGTFMNFLCFPLPGKFFTSSSLKYKCPVYRDLEGFGLHAAFHFGIPLSAKLRVESLLEILFLLWGDFHIGKCMRQCDYEKPGCFIFVLISLHIF